MRRFTRRFRFLIRLTTAFSRRHFLIIFLGGLFGILVFFLFLQIFKPAAEKEIRIGLVGRYEEGQIPDEIAQLASLGLTKLLPDGTATSSLAKSWETEEGKVYKFFLQDDILWQDGTKFTAKDIPYQFKHAQIEAISDFQIKITLKEPFSALPALVAKPIFKNGFLGVGDYQIDKLKKSGRFLDKIKLIPRVNNNSPSYTYRFYNTRQAAEIGFKLGEVDLLKGIANLGELKNWPGVKITPNIHQDRFAAVFFNLKSPKFEQKSFRQALAYGIKKKEGEERIYGPINSLSWAYNPKLKPYHQDLIHAKKLLNQEEHENSVNLFTFFALISQAEEIKKDWQQLGIETEVKIVNTLPEDFEALLAIWEMLPDPDQYSLWHSMQLNNLTGFANPKIDKLLEEGRKTFDQEKRKEIYQEFQKTLVEECPAIFLFHPVTYTISRE